MKPAPHPRALAFRTFLKNKTALAGAIYIITFVFIAFFAPFLQPDPSVDANAQELLISKKHPGFEVQMLLQRSETDEKQNPFETWLKGGKDLEHKAYPIEHCFLENEELHAVLFSEDFEADTLRFPAIGFANSNTPSKETLQELGFSIEKRRYYLGTDKYGRDLLSRLIAGSRISISVGFVAVLISLLLGLTLGALAGYFGGRIDQLITWFINVMWSVPTLLMVIAITLAFGKGFWQVFIAIGLTMWVEVARVVRGQFIGLRKLEYVEASRALGFSNARVIFKHILPNALAPIIVISAANFAAAILVEAGLSFLGIGAQIPTPSWGNMIKEHYALITTDLAYLAILPGALIMLLVLAFMLFGNGLRDALDVKSS